MYTIVGYMFSEFINDRNEKVVMCELHLLSVDSYADPFYGQRVFVLKKMRGSVHGNPTVGGVCELRFKPDPTDMRKFVVDTIDIS